MKYTIVLAIFLGLVSAEEPVWGLRSVNDHREDAAIQKSYGDHSTKQANGRPPYQSAFVQEESESESEDSSSSSGSEDVQLRGDDEEEDHSGEFFASWESSKAEDAKYTRVIPDRFSADSDDIFMRSMVNTYALEGKNKDGSPNGNFVVDEAGARAAAKEVLSTHKNLKGAALQDYLNTYFAKAWSHFDVNKGGKVEVIKMPQFMRFLASDQTMSLGE
mgnify:CR=1 FL=1